jgi:pSer/pThr/pTyr-binding forkhead associated (FHA) protein
MADELDRLEYLIGRDPTCHFHIADEYASPRHAKLTIYANQTVTIQDLGSTNGTYIDLDRIYGPTIVNRHSTLRIGRTSLRVVDLVITALRKPEGVEP